MVSLTCVATSLFLGRKEEEEKHWECVSDLLPASLHLPVALVLHLFFFPGWKRRRKVLKHSFLAAAAAS